MNIFNVLSQGKGSINEENMSAMLAFLLSDSQTHGLGDVFLKRFLMLVSEKTNHTSDFDKLINDNNLKIDVLLESPYQIDNGKKRIVDIELRLNIKQFNKNINEYEFKEVKRVCIENKVKYQSVDTTQFKEEFEGIQNDIEDDSNIEIIMVFLTPYFAKEKYEREYNELSQELLGANKKVWINWSNENDNCITKIITDLLRDESNAEINPINEYIRHTLKAFVRHIIETTTKSIAKRLSSNDDAEEHMKESIEINIKNKNYIIEMYESGTIRVFNLEKQEYEIAKPLLRKIIEEKKLSVNLNSSTGNHKNTRQLGKDVISELKKFKV
ncbi:MAG: PD-(D/E)XK nuclease family protein [Clostridium sp.]|uniref:PD-(D/E)XK nuclease family protein n=1 Tax=Clostridium sp. TaxID=1506 RepID=UPI0025BE6995|nr:PD-(D/E)XK nuclease family protein [Clostridium sp.]MCE5221798.1 PD-(D/E)XK nuclease family protein [Clostridium sp.]